MSTNQPKKITPVAVEATHVSSQQQVDIPNGRAFIIPIKNGAERPDLGFFFSERDAEKFYGDTEKYAIKKKINNPSI